MMQVLSLQQNIAKALLRSNTGDTHITITTTLGNIIVTVDKSSTGGVLVGSKPTFLATVSHNQSRLAEKCCA